MKKFLLLVALILSFAFDVNADDTSNIICKMVGYSHSIRGPIITVIIIGAVLLAIFGRVPWPALFALGAFIEVFFGTPTIVSKMAPDATYACSAEEMKCINSGKTWTPPSRRRYCWH
ncbi:MAG: TrbC/VirB2 family protein [Wolbachia sp.]|nr:TrbC/VirB2 family protein [Wolbachia sp.]MDD9335879.1 TrbC/VirB2 family protein [Wolbachia sp.]